MAMSGFSPDLAGFASSKYQELPQDLSNILYGIFGHPEAPYRDASRVLSQYLPQAQQYEMPFYQAGEQAIPSYQNWLQTMQNPSQFINQLMGKYQQSPWAKYQTDQAMRMAQNMGSASGLSGSTPLTQFAQQQAANISSQDMNNWLQNVLGVNTQYGRGEQGLINQGADSANYLSNLMQNYMGAQSASAFGQQYAKQRQKGSLLSGLTSLL